MHKNKLYPKLNDKMEYCIKKLSFSLILSNILNNNPIKPINNSIKMIILLNLLSLLFKWTVIPIIDNINDIILKTPNQ